MSKKTAIIATFVLLVMCFSLVSCSIVDSLLEEAGIDDLKEKLDTAWSEVGEEGVNNLIDDTWRDYGFGKSLQWPESGNGKHIPKLRTGDTVYSYANESGSSGCICMKNISDEDYDTYKLSLYDLGYRKSTPYEELTDVLLCDGLYIGFTREDDLFYICYGGTAADMISSFKQAKNENA